LLLVAGCGMPGADPSDVGTASAALQTGNGEKMNGEKMNGSSENGSGMVMGGVDLTTMSRLIKLPAAGANPDVRPSNLMPVIPPQLMGSMLANGFQSGTQFGSGYVVQGWVTDKIHTYPATYYIESVSVSPNDPDLYKYTIRTLHPQPDGGQDCNIDVCPMVWEYGCGSRTVFVRTATGSTSFVVPYQATAVGGQWNYQQGVPGGGRKVIEQDSPDYDTKITFACDNGAIGKCVENMGYKPWAMGPNECKYVCTTLHDFPSCRKVCVQHTLELMHEACVRMVRADYCGNGTPHTVTGVSIDEWDNANIQTETSISTNPSDHFGKEAEWTPNGARCLSQANMGRLDDDVTMTRLDTYLNMTCPDKWPNSSWGNNDCFDVKGGTPSTYYFGNVPTTSFDWHDRVFLRNTSMCVHDFDYTTGTFETNTHFVMPPCKAQN